MEAPSLRLLAPYRAAVSRKAVHEDNGGPGYGAIGAIEL